MATEGTQNKARCIISTQDIVYRMDMGELRSFVLSAVRGDEALEQALRDAHGKTDVEWAVRELREATDSFLRDCAWTGIDEWEAEYYVRDYRDAVEGIMRPFLQAENAEALVDLVVPRLEQFQQINLCDCEGFYTDALRDFYEHLQAAYDLGDNAQRERLFRLLVDFLEEESGEDCGEALWRERQAMEDFLGNIFARDARFAPAVTEYADRRLDGIAPYAWGELDPGRHEREKWSLVRLAAMATRGDTPGEVYEYAEEHDLLGLADAVRSLASAYAAAGDVREATAYLRANLDAREPVSDCAYCTPTRLVDCLEDYAEECYGRDELSALYRELLSREWDGSVRGHVTSTDLRHWWDRLRSVTDAAEWSEVHAAVLAEVPYARGNMLLAYEERFDELYERIMSNDGEGLMEYEDVLSEMHPEAYVELYLGQAGLIMGHARDRYAYRDIAKWLVRAAGLRGGQEPAAAVAAELVRANPRRRAFVDELRKAGFAV